jgi:hypothetical protein
MSKGVIRCPIVAEEMRDYCNMCILVALPRKSTVNLSNCRLTLCCIGQQRELVIEFRGICRC